MQVMLKPALFGIALTIGASAVNFSHAQYAFAYNPGPTQGAKWVGKAASEAQESTTSIVMGAEHSAWVRVCYSIGPSESVVAVFSAVNKTATKSTELAWGGCVDVFGTDIWIGNPNQQSVGGYYAVAPATPAR